VAWVWTIKSTDGCAVRVCTQISHIVSWLQELRVIKPHPRMLVLLLIFKGQYHTVRCFDVLVPKTTAGHVPISCWYMLVLVQMCQHGQALLVLLLLQFQILIVLCHVRQYNMCNKAEKPQYTISCTSTPFVFELHTACTTCERNTILNPNHGRRGQVENKNSNIGITTASTFDRL
jgi:hypothetical protein